MTGPRSLLTAALLATMSLVASCSGAPVTHPHPRASSSKSPAARASASPTPPQTAVVLQVESLPTTYGVTGPSASYPATLTVSVPDSLAGEVAAYAVAGTVVLGPSGWSGSGAVGADGSISFTISAATSSGGELTFRDDGGCAGCAWDDASAFFPAVAKALPSAGVAAGATPEAGLSTESLGSGLVGYSLPGPAAGIQVNGVAYTNLPQASADPIFEDLQLTLPSADHPLATLLLNALVQGHDRYLCPSGASAGTTSPLLSAGSC